MLDWIFEGIVTWMSSIAAAMMDAISGLFLNALGTDMLAMEEYFPFVTKAFEVMQYMAWTMLFLITVWQLFRTFGGPITEAENPWQLVARSALFAFLIGYAKPIFMMALDIARAPYLVRKRKRKASWRLNLLKSLEIASYVAFFSTWKNQSPGRKHGVLYLNRKLLSCTCMVLHRMLKLWLQFHFWAIQWMTPQEVLTSHTASN